MATTRQKQAARQNIAKAREVQSERAQGAKIPRQSEGLSTAQKDKLQDKQFAFPKERKEPLTDARHVRNAIARFDQVEGVTDTERDKAWKRILTAAKKYDVEVSESGWRDLAMGGNDSKSTGKATASKAKSPSTKNSGTKTSAAKASAAKASAAKASGKKTSGKKK